MKTWTMAWLVSAAALLSGCGGDPAPTPARTRTPAAVAEPEPSEAAPPSIDSNHIEPGTYAFPGQPLRSLEDRFYGHLYGLVPVELIEADETGFRVALDLNGRRTEGRIEAMTPVAPHTCVRRAVQMENGQLRAQVAPGGVVFVRGMDSGWAEISVGVGLSAIVPSEILSLQACDLDPAPLRPADPVGTPSYEGLWLACLFADPERAGERGTVRTEVRGRTPWVVLERRPGWRRVRLRHGAVTFEGWTPEPSDLSPAHRAPMVSDRAPVPPGRFPCRRTTRPLELSDEEPVRAPAGTLLRGEHVYVPLEPRGFLHLRTSIPDDALGPEEPDCQLGVWEPWEGYMGRCFYPGVELDATDADARLWEIAGGGLDRGALRDAARALSDELNACAAGAGQVVADLQIADDPPRVETATVVSESTTRPEPEARCVSDVLKRLPIPEVHTPTTLRVRVPFFDE